MDLRLAQEVTALFVPAKSGPHPKERLLLSTLMFGRRNHVQWELWSIPQPVVSSVIYEKRQMLALALPFS